MRCFRCDTELKPAIPIDEASETSPPGDALIFTAVGNYGSTVYDPMSDREALVIYICDACAIERKSVVRRSVIKEVVHRTLSEWNPESWNEDTD